MRTVDMNRAANGREFPIAGSAATQDQAGQAGSVAVVYLARGYDLDHIERFRAFADSYRSCAAGRDHRLYVVFKGFACAADRRAGESAFDGHAFTPIETDDLHFDIGAYIDALPSISEDFVCFLNTNSEIASSNWLSKLIRNLEAPGVGMVSATGSFESLHYINPTFPNFPNPHLRSNAFAIRRRHAEEILKSYVIRGKLDTFQIESGANGLTRRVLDMGLTCLIVGANGRGYPPQHWGESETFRQGEQANLLVHDNQTRAYARLDAAARHVLIAKTWAMARGPTVVELPAMTALSG